MLHERATPIRPWLPPDVKIDDAFSNAELKRRPTAFVEATTLIWLANAANHTVV
jgi:hypothetical protein